jgi:hypothetical protein
MRLHGDELGQALSRTVLRVVRPVRHLSIVLADAPKAAASSLPPRPSPPASASMARPGVVSNPDLAASIAPLFRQPNFGAYFKRTSGARFARA